MLDNYLEVWEGHYDLAEATFMPAMDFITDRNPSPTGYGNGSTPTHLRTSEELLDLIRFSRDGWDEYGFQVDRWASNEYEIAVRWRLNAVMGVNFTSLPTTLEEGDFATWNGTDFLILDRCTGLIKEVNSAHDGISFLHSLGIKSVSI
ncbi:hypothetical protein ACJZ2D_008665 [Fusarium nematophilum]